ncbi:MAG: AraC family transcriptional regulator [Coprobacillus cateniformis]
MNYQKALEDAIIYIENHLEEDIRVEEVAHSVGYSYFHFNRQFQALIGESVGNYIKTTTCQCCSPTFIYAS